MQTTASISIQQEGSFRGEGRYSKVQTVLADVNFGSDSLPPTSLWLARRIAKLEVESSAEASARTQREYDTWNFFQSHDFPVSEFRIKIGTTIYTPDLTCGGNYLILSSSNESTGRALLNSLPLPIKIPNEEQVFTQLVRLCSKCSFHGIKIQSVNAIYYQIGVDDFKTRIYVEDAKHFVKPVDIGISTLRSHNEELVRLSYSNLQKLLGQKAYTRSQFFSKWHGF